MIELTELPIDNICKYIEKAIKIAEEVMIDYDKQFQLQKAIFYISIEMTKIGEIHAKNGYLIKTTKSGLRQEARQENKTDRSTSEALNRQLQEPIALHEFNEAIIEEKLKPAVEALNKIASAVKDERINGMAQAKITGNFSSKEGY